MKDITDEGKVLLYDVMNEIKEEIRTLVNHYTGEDPCIELILNKECAAFQFLLDNKIEMKVTLSPTLSIFSPASTH
ncbi:hypothetical protein ACXV6R_000671 [Yersinia enterocolitica]|nr:hypothetical protein [Yersinia enterocolitica]